MKYVSCDCQRVILSYDMIAVTHCVTKLDTTHITITSIYYTTWPRTRCYTNVNFLSRSLAHLNLNRYDVSYHKQT